MATELGLENAEDDLMECLVYHRMWSSDACWKTVGEVATGLKKLNYKKDKLAALKDNIQIRYLGLGWDECKTSWSVDKRVLTVADLTRRLKELIKMEKKHKWVAPEKPAVPVPRRKSITFMGTATKQVAELDRKARESENVVDERARKRLKERDQDGTIFLMSELQQKHAPPLEDLVDKRIAYRCEVDLDETGTQKGEQWMYGVVKRVSDGTWLVSKNARTKCHKAGEAAEVLWDAVPELGYVEGRTIVALNPKLWNKDKLGAWCKDVGKIDYGV